MHKAWITLRTNVRKSSKQHWILFSASPSLPLRDHTNQNGLVRILCAISSYYWTRDKCLPNGPLTSNADLTLLTCLTMTLYSQFSFGATDLELTAKRDKYPLFFRTVPTDFVFNEPRLRFIQRFGWKDEIGMIYDASPYYSRVGHYLN